jgi:hypothetical protein
MRKVAFTILGAFLIAGSALQMAAASEHHMRTGRGHHQTGRAPNHAAPSELDSYGKPAANVTQTCDTKWCYADWYRAFAFQPGFHSFPIAQPLVIVRRYGGVLI